MLRRDADEAAAVEVEEVTPGPCATKIRKRCALSSSSGASDALRCQLRLKRGVVLFRRSRRGSSPTPCPGNRRKMSESSWNGRCRRADGMHSSVSARKLVNALWQMNEGGLLEEERPGTARDPAAHRRCASSVEISKRSRTKSKVLDADHGDWFSDKLSNGGRIGVHDSSSTCSVDTMTHLQDMYHSLTASKELVRVLGNVWGAGVPNPSTAASLLSALRSELDLARAHARQLAKEQSRRGDEVELLKKRLAAEAHAWKSKQREKVAATVRLLADELDGERRSRRRAERVNAKLGKSLAETESSLEAAERELQRERRSRERLEKVCDELVRGAASTLDRGGEVEEMRREAERSQAEAELDKEREMLRLADELREERVQMKLLEARLQFEEKNAVVELLRGELEAFLETKKQESSAADASHDHHASEAEGADGIARVAVSKRTDGDNDDDDNDDREEDDDSNGSDMHSIELNMDGNIKDCGWSYSSTAANSKDMSTSKKAASAGSRGTECAADPWAGASFDRRSVEESEGGHQWDVDDDSTRDIDEDSERYQAIKNLREQMLAGHGFIFMSPADEPNADREQQRYGVI